MRRENPEIPGWARRDRQRDLDWIRENLHMFWPLALDAFRELGRGAIVVDTTSRPAGQGNPFGYLPREVIEQADDEDVKRIVREYDPAQEFVLVLLKSEERTSTYRVQPLPRKE